MYKKTKLEKPFFINENTKWYHDEYFNEYISSKQASNLPALKNIFCCIVIDEDRDINDWVLLDNKQNILAKYNYLKDYEQLEAKINIIKISKHFDNHE